MYRSPMLSAALPHEASGKIHSFYVSVRICGDMEDSEMVVVSNNLVLVFSQEGKGKMTTTTATEWKWTGSPQGKLDKEER